jgi:hypothetical protein
MVDLNGGTDGYRRISDRWAAAVLSEFSPARKLTVWLSVAGNERIITGMQ